MLDGMKCYLCRKEFRLEELTIDHVVPYSRGDKRRNYKINLRLACKPCNEAKGDMTLEEYRAVEDSLKTQAEGKV